MVLENGVNAVIMATGLFEKGEPKCEPYWPRVAGGVMSVGPLRITCLSLLVGPACDQALIEVAFSVKQKSGNSIMRTHIVKHFWYHAWPDHGVPRKADNSPDPSLILELLDSVQTYLEDCAKRHKMDMESGKPPSQKSGGPLVVHCSAGVGRSGTIIAIDSATRALHARHTVDVHPIVAGLRKDRVMLVQHAAQYELVLEACKQYAAKHTSVWEVSAAAKEM
jgi:protein tyrosine phosphatase